MGCGDWLLVIQNKSRLIMHVAFWMLGVHFSYGNSASDIVKTVEDKYSSVQSIQLILSKRQNRVLLSEISVKGQVV